LTLSAVILRVLAAVLIVELVLRLLLPLPMFARYLRGPMGARIVVQRALGHETPEGARDVDPLLGWTNAPGGGLTVKGQVHTTTQRLRGTRVYSPEKRAGILRVEVFGDSFAFGSEVDDESTFSAVLEMSLPRAEVLDFGVIGYGLDQALLRFRKDGPAWHPDVVVIGFVSALLQRDTQAFTSYPKPYFVLRGGKLDLEGVPVPDLDEAMRPYVYSSRILDVWRMMTFTEQPNEALDRALLVEFVTEIRASGARPLVVRYPGFSEIGRGSSYTGLYRDVCTQTGATCVDTCPAFDAASARGVALSAPMSHFNEAGHRIVAGALAEALRDRLPTSPTSPSTATTQ
jgi:hypothetical protein